MYHFSNVTLKNVDNVLSQMTYGASRGAVFFSSSSHENNKNISHLHDLGINYRNLVCLSLIFEAITIILILIIVIVTCICNLP